MAMKILVVDDSSIMRKMVGRALQLTGLPIERIGEANDGFGALDELRAKPYDLVMMDLNMPNLDGLGLTKAIRANATHRYTPILLLTTESDPARKAEGKAAGATGWLVKPFQPEQLLATIRKVLA